jgi:hypothetical protein
MTFKCETCGEEHDNWPPDRGYSRPDEIWAMPPAARNERVNENDDVCELDDARFFMRGVLFIPVAGLDAPWGLGLWVEVAKADYDRYVELYNEDASGEPPFPGTIANAFPGIPATLGARVQVQLGTDTERPTFRVLDTGSELGRAQHEGIDVRRLHELLDAR